MYDDMGGNPATTFSGMQNNLVERNYLLNLWNQRRLAQEFGMII